MRDKIEGRLEGIGSQVNWGMVQQGQGWRMVGIQIGREQEEGKREEDAGFEKIEDFNVTSNAEEQFEGAEAVFLEIQKIEPNYKEGDLEKAIIISKENGAKGISIFTADGLNKEQQSVFVKLKNKL